MHHTEVLSKETLMPIGVALALLAPLVGAAFFLAGMRGDVADLKIQNGNNSARIEAVNVSLQNNLTTIMAKVSLIDNRQTEIDTKFNYISNTLDEIRKKLNILP